MYAAAARAVLFPAHCCNCKRAQRDAAGARCGARADDHACFRPPCQTDRMRERRRVFAAEGVRRLLGRCGVPGEICIVDGKALEPVYTRIIFFCSQSREQRNTAFPGALVCIGKCCRIAASRIQSKPLRKPAVFCPYLLRPRACPSLRATTRQRRERRYSATAQKCSPRPCAAPHNAAAAL